MRRKSILSVLITAVFFPHQQSVLSADPLDLIPADASVVIRLQAPSVLVADVANFVDKVQPGFGAMVEPQATVLGRLIANNSLDGVDRTKPWFIAIFAQSKQRPDVLVVVPTTDIGNAQDAVGDEFQFTEKDEWLAYSKSKSLVRQVEDCLGGNLSNISSQLDESGQKQLDDVHLSVFVNGTSLKKTFAAELAQAEEQLDRIIDKIADQAPSNKRGVDLKHVWEMYREMGRTVLGAIGDSTSLIVTVNIADDNLEIEKFLNVHPESATDKFFKEQPVSEMSRLNSLPDGLPVYAGVSGDPQALLAWAEKFTDKIITDESTRIIFQKSMAEIKGTKPGTMSIAGDFVPGESGAMRYFAINEFSPASKVRNAFSHIGSGVEYNVGGIHQTLSYTKDAEKINGYSVDLYHVKQEFPKELDPGGVQKAMFDMMYGKDGLTQRLLFQEDLLFMTMGGGQESMKQLLRPGTWSASALTAARFRLPEKANLLTLVDMPIMTQRLLQLVVESGTVPIPISADELATLEIPQSYVGFSLAVAPHGLHIRANIPVETIQGFVKLGMFMQQFQRRRR